MYVCIVSTHTDVLLGGKCYHPKTAPLVRPYPCIQLLSLHHCCSVRDKYAHCSPAFRAVTTVAFAHARTCMYGTEVFLLRLRVVSTFPHNSTERAVANLPAMGRPQTVLKVSFDCVCVCMYVCHRFPHSSHTLLYQSRVRRRVCQKNWWQRLAMQWNR